MVPHLPLFMEGEVVKGFGRGSKDLGIPTANFPLEVVQALPKDFKAGVYYGLAQINTGPVYRMVVNIGWCPFYDNKDMSVETHVMHKFSSDFYGSHMRIVVLGYLREELNFTSLEGLVEAIHNDIRTAHKELNSEQSKKFLSHDFFKTSIKAT